MQPEKQSVIKAINDLGRSVTASDVAAKTGLSLHAASINLNRVASETRSNLEVSSDGTLIYKFAPLFEANYAATGVLLALQTAWRTFFTAFYFAVRISFGIALIGSVIAGIVLMIVIVLSAINGGGGDGSGGDAGGIGEINLGGGDIGDFFIGQSSVVTADGSVAEQTSYEAYLTGTYSETGKIKKSFLMTCYSFLFGDGDPNKGFDDKNWQWIASHIIQNNGVTTSEQLAPYLASDPHDDNAVLPVLVRFEGTPQVTETGNIVYQFPGLLSSASQVATAPPFAKEKNWVFSNCLDGDISAVTFFAALNVLLAGCVWRTEAFMPWLHKYHVLIMCMVIYGLFFVGLPVLRLLYIHVVNAVIDAKNEIRQKSAELLQNADSKLRQKLWEAQSFALAAPTQHSVVYTTEKDLIDQQFAD